MPPPKKPILHLTGPRTGLPTLDDLIALARALSGRDPTQAEIEAARMILTSRTHTS